jgi:hypothetical protein
LEHGRELDPVRNPRRRRDGADHFHRQLHRQHDEQRLRRGCEHGRGRQPLDWRRHRFDLVAGFGGSAGSNGGKIAVADGGTLGLSGSFLNGGAIALSGAGSATAFELNNAVISGGKAQTIGAGAAIESMSGASDTLKGVAILASSLIEVASPAR